MAKTATDPGYAACPIRNIVDRFGDKWSLLVLYNLHTGGRLRFSEIHRRMTDISQKMLASTLRRLEQDGLLSRTVYPEVPPRVEYALTPRGESLMPHLVSLIGWALENFDAIVSDRNSLQAYLRILKITHPKPPSSRLRTIAVPATQPAPSSALSDATAIGSCNRPGQTSVPAPTNTSDKCPRQMHPANAPGKCTRQMHPAAPCPLQIEKVPSGTFSILPFRKHKPRAVPCRSRDKSP